MKHILRATALCLSVGLAQTTLYSENFEGTTHSFTLNTTELSSTASGKNVWVVNNAYTGGAGTINCTGFPPLPYSVGATSSQPGTYTGGPNSKYLHVLSTDMQASGILNCNFQAADGAFCLFPENYFARMTADISTSGYNGVTFEFGWLCLGETGNNYGEVYYSTNSGSSWSLLTSPISQYSGQSSWTSAVITDPAFDNQSTLRFGFRFFNGIATAATDPGFAIDEIKITGTPIPSVSIATGLTASSYCVTGPIAVIYTSSGGTFTSGNIFTAELSDATGSFASPYILGTLPSTAASGSIAGTVPSNVPSGTGYRVRVVSSAPSVTGTDNGSDVQIDSFVVAGFTYSIVGLTATFSSAPSRNETSYTWYFGDGIADASPNPVHAYPTAGAYEVWLMVNNACFVDTLFDTLVVGTVGLAGDPIQQLGVFPNPAHQEVTIVAPLSTASEIHVSDVTGHVVLQTSFPVGGRMTLPVAELPSGTYFVSVPGSGLLPARLVISH